MSITRITRILLFLLVFLAPLKIGWIFRHNNGVLISDIPLFFLLVLGLLSGHKFRFYWRLPVLGFILWCTFAGAFADRFDMVFSELTRFIRAYLAFLCVVNFTRQKKDFDVLFFAILSAFAFQSVIGFLEWRRGYLGLSFLGEESFYYRVGALFVHPNIFGDYLIFFLPVLMRLFVFYKHKKILWNGAYGVLFLIGVGALLATLARGAWLSFAGAIVIMLLYTLFRIRFYPKVVSAFMFLALLATIFTLHYTPTIIMQFQGDYRGRAASVRMPLNRIAFKMIKDYPVLGVGAGNYEEHTYKYAEDEVSEKHHYWELLQIVHNTYLLNLAEYGIPGFLIYLWMIGLVFKNGRRVINKKNPFISNLGLGVLTGYVALLVAFMAGPDGRNHQIQMMFWIYAGFLLNLTKIKSETKPEKPKTGKIIHPEVNKIQHINVNRVQTNMEKLHGR